MSCYRLFMLFRNGCLNPWIASFSVLSSLATAPATLAQIIPDNTLPTPSSVELGCTVCTIEGGTLRGNNLFHSFTEFSVPTGGEATFNNLDSVEHIFSRVTGHSVSDINGFIRANGTANLFLINPNGIIFGPNAQLDIGGSFLASTADAIQFEDQVIYSAFNPDITPLITVSAPIGLQYGSQPTGAITNAGVLSVTPSKSLILLGEEIILESGHQLSAPGGRVELTTAQAWGLGVDGGVIPLDFAEQNGLGDALIVNADRVDVTGGHIVFSGMSMNGGNLAITTDPITEEQINLTSFSQSNTGTVTIDVHLVAQGCNQTTIAQQPQGEFYNTGRSGSASSPMAVLGSDDILEDLQPPVSWQAAATPNDPITEAHGWQINENEVMLLAEPSLFASQRRCWR